MDAQRMLRNELSSTQQALIAGGCAGCGIRLRRQDVDQLASVSDRLFAGDVSRGGVRMRCLVGLRAHHAVSPDDVGRV